MSNGIISFYTQQNYTPRPLFFRRKTACLRPESGSHAMTYRLSLLFCSNVRQGLGDNLNADVVEIKNGAYLACILPPSYAHHLFLFKPIHGKACFIQVGKGGNGLSQRDKMLVKCQ